MYTLAKVFEEAQVENFPEWFSGITLASPDNLSEEEFKPRWHQITGLNLAMLYDRAAFYDEQGTGKAFISQAWAIWNAAVGNKTLCLMPPILVGQYMETLQKTFVGITEKLKIEAYFGTKAKRQKLQNKWNSEGFPDIVVMSYQMLMKEWLLFHEYQAVVADEARLADLENKTNQALLSFMGEPGEKNALVLNGTPASNNLSNLYGFIEFITPGLYRSKLHFNTLHVVFKDIPVRVKHKGEIVTREITVIDSFRNTDILHQNLYKQARRVEKHQVLELKEKNIIPFSFRLSPAHEAAYEKFTTELLLEFDDGAILDGSTSVGLRTQAMQAVMHPEKLQVNEVSAVLEAIDHLVETIIPRGKFLIFAHHRSVVELLAKHLSKHNPAVIYGGSDTEKNRVKFLKDDTCKGCVANWSSGGVGLNFQSVCADVISAEPTTIPGQFDQAIDRAHRSGQKKVVNVYILMPKKTLYIKAVSDMVKKRKSNQSVVSKGFLAAELAGEDVTEDKGLQGAPESGQDLASGWQQL